MPCFFFGVKMATADDVRRLALSLEGTTEAPHFDRVAFRAVRIYATLAPGGRSMNLKLTPDEQELKCLVAPEVFSRIPNAWGEQGWTEARLDRLDQAGLAAVLEMAWEHGRATRQRRRR